MLSVAAAMPPMEHIRSEIVSVSEKRIHGVRPEPRRLAHLAHPDRVGVAHEALRTARSAARRRGESRRIRLPRRSLHVSFGDFEEDAFELVALGLDAGDRNAGHDDRAHDDARALDRRRCR